MLKHLKELGDLLRQSGLPVKYDEPLAPFTTIGVGGPAALLVNVQTAIQLKQALAAARQKGIPALVLGKGSNLIISDEGFEGLAIINNSADWQIVAETDVSDFSGSVQSRYEKALGAALPMDDYLKLMQINGSVIVRADSGIRIAALSKALYKKGIVGLEWFAGIPSTLGGGLYMNMHGGPLFLGDLVEKAVLFDGEKERTITRDDFHFAYDYSILHDTKETVLTVDLRLWKGQVKSASEFAKKWAREKSMQPRHSAGCVFQNLSPEQQSRLKISTSSTGYVIDRLLGLKGRQKGGAVISHKHAAFIENVNQASARDVYDLIRLIRDEAKKKLDLDLKLEIQFIGSFKRD
ncbi:MAG: FAD-binding protein [Calditrichaceae bacterium]|nr:FAD-binding protein [Calditrichaceae bacterium]MBN2708702.1 FAD-binding protein [Calditrichaceae bacterium]RQV92814.1 MAG: FAD-binding protein [Calditrichota bacterium]